MVLLLSLDNTITSGVDKVATAALQAVMIVSTTTMVMIVAITMAEEEDTVTTDDRWDMNMVWAMLSTL